MTDNRRVFGHTDVERNQELLGRMYECGRCGLRGETLFAFDNTGCSDYNPDE